MKSMPSLGAYLWFAFGVWTGFSASQIADVLRGVPLKVGSVTSGSNLLDLPVLVSLYALPAAFLSLPFAAWCWLRGCSKQGKPSSLVYWFPLACGAAYLPVFGYVLLPLLIRVLNEGQGWRIGSCVGLYSFGMPVVFAEIWLRLCSMFSAPTPEASSKG
jgi:hypothetical protein